MLASGSGTNLQALLEVPSIREQIVVVVADRPAAALDRAAGVGVPTETVTYSEYPSREAFSAQLADVLEAHGAKGVVLAGFMRVVSPVFVDRFRDRILNIHPSLLPSFPGRRAVEDALEAGVRVTGVTVHFVDEMVDHGPIVAQVPVTVDREDTPATLHRRIQEIEHSLYPEVVEDFVSGRLWVEEGRVVRL